NVLARMMLKGWTTIGRMYTQKLLVRPIDLMMRKIGIRPALKYIVMMTERYQNWRFNRRSCVNMNPREAEARTVRAVPITVRATEITAARGSPCRSNTWA